MIPEKVNYSSQEVSVKSISLAWRNLRVNTPGSLWAKSHPILRRLNGYLRYHSLTGFLGPSGSGKTTLLNALNGSLRCGLGGESEIYLHRTEQGRPSVALIQQHIHETMIGNMTVREILYFAYRFKNANLKRMRENVESIVNELMLDRKILRQRFSQCSGGEQKRIAVAQELMSHRKPRFMFLDEPTTGLDSTAAHLLIQCLSNLCHAYRMSIALSIHLPSNETLDLFDQLYILAKGGVCVYSGLPKQLKLTLKQELGVEVRPDKPPIEEYLMIASQGN